jgi:ABC-2 type transport system ATP-binding protein
MMELKNVTKKYGRKLVLDDVSMTFKKGEITCLLGLNGVGKSTTMKAIMRLIPISKGTITIDGVPITSKNMNRIGYVPDIPIYDLSWTAPQNLEFAQIFYPNFDIKKAERLTKFLKLPTDKKLKDLSKGNLARFNLIVGLCQYADYLLLDEPFSGIDVFTRETFIKALKSDFLEEGQTVIITTHEIDEIQNIADTVILLEEGRVFQSFSKSEAEAEGLSIVEKMRTLYHPEQGEQN